MDRIAHTTVLVRWTYVTPAQARLKIRRMQRTCRKGPFLDCLVEFAEATTITRAFAEALQDPSLEDPDEFLRATDFTRASKSESGTRTAQ